MAQDSKKEWSVDIVETIEHTYQVVAESAAEAESKARIAFKNGDDGVCTVHLGSEIANCEEI